jgi:hypothetical protein
MHDLMGLTTEDDTLHPRTADPWWTETVWFGWMVPERNILGYFYPVFRANLGVQFGGVLVVDEGAELPWELPFFEYDWHRTFPADVDLRHMSLDNGMRLDCIEPAMVYEFGYQHRDLTLDLRYEAIMPPLVTRGTPPFNNGHIDQIGQVRGTMVLRGEEISVDCFAMRDRSWGPRQDGRQPKVGYAYATASADSCFLSISIDRNGDDRVSTGFHWRDGVWSRLSVGQRTVERDEQGRPARITIDAADELGRPVQAVGTPLSRQVFTAYPSMFCWNSLVKWTYDGVECFGEDQDVWHPRRWRDYASTLRSTVVR